MNLWREIYYTKFKVHLICCGYVLLSAQLALISCYVMLEKFSVQTDINAAGEVPVFPCRSDQTNDHKFRAHRIFLDPPIPQFPGNVNASMLVEIMSPGLPTDLDMKTSLRLVIPYLAYRQVGCINASDSGCGGFGSCTYCDILGYCEHLRRLTVDPRVLQSSMCQITPGFYRLDIFRSVKELPVEFQKRIPMLPSEPLWEIGVRLRDRVTRKEVGCGVSYVKTRLKTFA